jgi:hypothetical protein
LNTSIPKEFSVYPRRLAKLFGAVLGGLILLAVIAVASVAEWPKVTAILWHLRNGNTVELSGPSFSVPLLYEPEFSKDGSHIDIMKSPGLFSRGASVTVESSPRALDSGDVDRWQALLVNAGKENPKTLTQTSPVTLRGQKLTFVCVNLGFPGGESLLCHTVGTNLIVSTGATSTDVRDTRAVLEKSN